MMTQSIKIKEIVKLQDNKENKEMQIGPFMNLLTDFGFKRVFGRKQSKPFLIRFLNLLLFAENDEKIENLEFLETENLGNYVEDRKVVFDLKCKTNKGETIIIEMQKARQKYFKARSFFYGCSSIVSQAVKGVWDFDIKKVYVVSLLNFELEHSTEMMTYFDIMPRNNTKVTLDYMSLLFIELPKFTKELKDCVNELEQWIYIIRHLGELKDAPDPLKELENWHQFFELANIPKKATVDYRRYLRELQNAKEFDSVVGVILAEVEEVIEKLEKSEVESKEKSIKLAKKMLQYHEPVLEIIAETGLSKSEIINLKQK